MDNLEFTKLTPEELPAVLEIYNHYILNTTATFHMHPLTLEEMRGIVFFDSPNYQTFSIKTGEALCGYVLLTRYKPREAYDGTAEVTVYLKPGYTGKGIGAQAIRFIEQFARQKQFHALLAIITGGNTPSIKAFEKNGYIKCAHFKEVGKKFEQLLDVVAYQKIVE